MKQDTEIKKIFTIIMIFNVLVWSSLIVVLHKNIYSEGAVDEMNCVKEGLEEQEHRENVTYIQECITKKMCEKWYFKGEAFCPEVT